MPLRGYSATITPRVVMKMTDITAIDSNFSVQTNLNVEDLRFYDPCQSPFHIYGVFYEDGKFRRLPEKVAETVNEGVLRLHSYTAGGRVRFKTDSPYVAIYAKMPNFWRLSHFALTGTAGFDLYADNAYEGTFMMPYNMTDGYESIVRFPSGKMREITINMPLYGAVDKLYIGLSDKAAVCAPDPYRFETPVVYYGSSITQGGCASRAGMSYESILSRRLNTDYINLGFSGNAKGEDEIADYIAGLPMSCFVYDYDHNAPTVEHLAKTHERMFRRIRKVRPELPIIMMSRPKYHLTAEDAQRLEIIKTTYENAVNSGDKNVYLLEGKKLFELAGCDGSVDNCHPNDLGFASMAKALGDVLEKILK